MGTGASSGTGSSTAVEALQYVERLGRYRLLARLGQGGMGTIHLAVAFGLADFRKLLVVKELRRELTSNERFVEMFLAEAKLAARLDHPNIVQTLEAGQDDQDAQDGERYYLAMEFLDGQPLIEILKRVDSAQSIPTSLLIQILCEVLAGLHYAHELCDYDETPLHIVHRDVNPHNVFVTYNGHVKLVDFGIAKVIDSEMCTTAGVFKGKFPYAAPEQVNCQKVDRRADVFAVGVMLWEILAQRRFAPGQPTTAAIDARLAGAEPRISTVRPDIDPELAAICDHAMHVDPALRYRTAEEFRSDLLDFLAARTEMHGNLTLADLMKREFSQERAAAHRVISSQVRRLLPDEDLPDSLVRVLTRSNTSPGIQSGSTPARGLPGSIAHAHALANDASKLDTSRARPGTGRRSDAPPLMNGELQTLTAMREQQNMRAIKVCAIAAVAFVGAYFLVRAKIDERAVAPAPAPAAQQAAAPAASPAPAASTAPAATPASIQDPPAPAEAAPSDAARPSTLAASAARGGGTRAARSAREVGEREVSEPDAESTAADSTRALARSPHAGLGSTDASSAPLGAAEPRRARRAVLPTAAEPSRPEGRALVSTSNAAGAAGSGTNKPRSLEVGDDLRGLRQSRRPRALSLEDPFQ
jgi:eukaryotic-like serine/threonine-protein kinase